MSHSSCIELSRSALARNIRYLRQQVGPTAAFVSVVKANAYGHGIEVFVPLAEDCGVTRFAVFSASEARAAAEVKRPHTALMVIGFLDPTDMEWAVSKGVSFWVHSRTDVDNALRAATTVGKPAAIHLDVETGLHRTGLDAEQLPEIISTLRGHPEQLRPEGLCSHLAGAESSANHLRIQNQMALFHEISRDLLAQGVTFRYRHMACSAAAFVYPETRLDMVRFGIAQYGFWPSLETKIRCLVELERPKDPLRRVLTWRSRLVEVKEVPVGRFVGYGNTYLTTRRTRLGVVPVGYSHGYSRNLSNYGHVLVRGRRAPVVGVVGMNMLTADITDTPDAAIGDEVVLIGKQGRQTITVASFAEMSQFLNYEMLARLSTTIPRVVVR